MDHQVLRARFPGVRGDWARFDGPAGTQMVDTAIAAMAQFAASGDVANSHGTFAASRACDDLVERARAVIARFYGADSEGVWFGANMTTMTFAFTRAVTSRLEAGDRIVGTRLDHDGNVWTWRRAAIDAGVDHVLAPIDAATGRLDADAVIDLIDERTRWVAIAGASNLLGTIPDVRRVADAAHAAGANVFVDAVALAPHRTVEVDALGADAIVSSAYKWYGPHLGAMWVRSELLESLAPYKVRPSDDKGPSRFETGTANYEGLAALVAAAEFVLETGMKAIREIEDRTFAPLLSGLLGIDRIRVFGPHDLVDRTPTVSFIIDGQHPDETAARLAEQQIAVWSGNSYAVELADSLGVESSGGVVRAGVVAYVDEHDVERLLDAVARIAAT